MRALLMRGITGLALGSWLISACLGQFVWLHVATEHHGHHHGHRHAQDHLGFILMGPHAADHGDHDHRLATTRGPGLPSPRPQAATPVLAILPVEWSGPAPCRAVELVPIPPPRGSPQRQAILLI